MSPRRRRFSPVPLAGLSLALLALPPAVSHKARLTALSAFAPLRGLARAAVEAVGRWIPPAEDAELRRQNDLLQGRLAALADENARLRAGLEQASNIRALTGRGDDRLLQADVVLPADSSAWKRSLTVALGTRGGARKGMPVLYHNRLVGCVAEAGPWESRVQLVTDPGFRARAATAPAARPQGAPPDRRQIGIYEGTSGGGILKWLTSNTLVGKGTIVVTTEDPANGIPAGLVLGRVASASSGRGRSLHVEVEPVLNFRGLDQVTLLWRETGR